MRVFRFRAVITPDDPDCWYSLGNNYMDAGMLIRLSNAFSKACDLDLHSLNAN